MLFVFLQQHLSRRPRLHLSLCIIQRKHGVRAPVRPLGGPVGAKLTQIDAPRHVIDYWFCIHHRVPLPRFPWHCSFVHWQQQQHTCYGIISANIRKPEHRRSVETHQSFGHDAGP